MIDSPPHSLDLWPPVHAVIERAAGKERDCGQSENPQGNAAAQFVGDGNQGQAGDEGDGGHDQMDDPAKFGLGKICRSLGFNRIHPLTIRLQGKKSGKGANPPFLGEMSVSTGKGWSDLGVSQKAVGLHQE